MSDEIAIKVHNVSKQFRLPHEQATTIKSIFANPKSLIGRKETTRQQALRDVSFEVKKGEFFGIVGRNGSGKSTLLKIMAGIYQPTTGGVKIHGKLVPFIELGVGFNPELTGKENVYLNGAMLGFSRKEIDKRYKHIVEFAELEQFMDQKLKNYSSGMQVRLAFSVAIQADADILLIDEVLAVGDEAFQKKCYQYFAEIRQKNTTVILVTHSMDTIQQFCTRAMLVDKKHEMTIGSPLKISQIYQELNDQAGVTVNRLKKSSKSSTDYVSASVKYKGEDDTLKFDILVEPKQDLDTPVVTLEVFQETGEELIRWTTDEKLEKPIVLQKGKKLNLQIEFQDILPVGIFSVRLMVRKKDRSQDYAVFNDIILFEKKNKSPYRGNVFWQPEEKYSLKVIDE